MKNTEGRGRTPSSSQRENSGADKVLESKHTNEYNININKRRRRPCGARCFVLSCNIYHGVVYWIEKQTITIFFAFFVCFATH
jgi:hypothetical protein